MADDLPSLVVNEYPPDVVKRPGVLKDDLGHTNVSDDDITEESIQTKVYKRRWYVLVLYSLLACTQGGYWNIWGPIAASTEQAFGWTDGDIAMLSNWGPISFILSAFVLSWVVDVKGLRWACLSTATLVSVGAGLRCITDKPPYVKWTVNIAQILNGLAGPVSDGVPPVISARWFPINERVKATAVSITISYVGSSMIDFILGPHMVPDDQKLANKSDIFNTSYIHDHNETWLNHTIHTNATDIVTKKRKEIMMLMYIEFGWCLLILLLMLIYFPSKPPLPPTKSASVERPHFKSGLQRLAKNTRFLLLCFTFALSLGVFSSWQSVIDIILKPHKISEEKAGFAGFFAMLAGCVGSLVVAALVYFTTFVYSYPMFYVSDIADVFVGHMKLFLVSLYSGASLCFLWFTLTIYGALPSSTVSLYVAIILATLLLNSTIPLYFETAAEVAYPVSEGITNFVLTLVNNIGGLVFLVIQMIPNIGTSWENWCLFGAVASCIPILLMFKEKYNRLEVDTTNSEAKPDHKTV